MTEALVKTLNALPHAEKVSPEPVTNKWYFDVRFVPLNPPSHLLTIIQTNSGFIHTEELSVGGHSIAYFPESSQDAAPEIAKALIRVFVENIAPNAQSGNASALTSWSLVTEHKQLADAVSSEFEYYGATVPELLKIGTATSSTIKTANDVFSAHFKKLKLSLDLDRLLSSTIATPTNVAFHVNTRIDRKMGQKDVDEEVTFEDVILRYASQLCGCAPPLLSSFMGIENLGPDISQHYNSVRDHLSEHSTTVAQIEAADGDPMALLDCGIRLFIMDQREMAREYLVKAILSPRASDACKATAHGILINWNVTPDNIHVPSRYLIAATYHANEAAVLCRKASPKGAQSSASVLRFMYFVFDRIIHLMPGLYLLSKDAVRALEKRKAQVAKEDEYAINKRNAKPDRYQCANPDCDVEANKGKMLSRCAGKCDPDKKPSYCSKACQIADRPHHKRYCCPGAESSVFAREKTLYKRPSHVISIDALGPDGYSSAQPASAGAIQMEFPGGVTLSSSIMTAESMKEVREEVQRLCEEDRGRKGNLA